ncbi:hypothetical protein [Polyangium mundeleinium]|uniref:J domain-containing protein n=1 Tax=Polyangium mundeleinium TaxID=2995306 RepID=A0ABT5EI00_9BACT|nr:hypothetical protein [Polyangium mundeleinium]MDC0741007.1 hypothetical protein [Polyangium mundeleinium]
MPAMEEAPNTPRRDVILIADASAEGQTIASALRAQGFAVAFAPIERLEARVLDEAPRVVLVDIDQPGARDAIERLRELPGGEDAELVCLGSRLRAAEIGAHSAAGRSFARPLDIHAIVAQIAALADPAPLDDSIVDDRGAAAIRPGETVPPGLLDDGTGTFPPAFQSAFPGAPEIAEMGASIFPPDESDGQSPPTLLPSHPMQLSPELMTLLASAEQRVLAQTPASSVPPPAVAAEEDADLILADEFLAILDEPLDAEADSSQSDLANTGLDPGTGPNAALSITTGSFALAEGHTTAPNPAPPSTAALEPPSVGELVLDMPPTPKPSEPTVTTAPGGSTPRSSETRAVSSEAPATAWEPRPTRITDDAGTPIRPMETTTTATRSIEPRPSSAPTPPRPPPPVIEPMIDVAPPTVFPARWTVPGGLPRFASTLGGYAPASGATPPNPRTLGGYTPASGATPPNPRTPGGYTPASGNPPSPPTAPNILTRASDAPPPSVRLAPPVPPPPAPVPSSQTPHASQGPRSEQPTVLGPGDAPRALARAIASRATGSLALHEGGAVRRVVLQDGDVVTAGSGVADEALLSFLSARGDLERDVAHRLAGKLPPSGRHAGAALIAHGFLQQDALWPVLRAHAEWIIGRAILVESGTLELEAEPPGRLRAEPNVFGGATGAEVFVEIVRRVIPPEASFARLGGAAARFDAGPRMSLLSECALVPDEAALVAQAPGTTVGELAAQAGHDLTPLLYALVCLEVLTALTPARPASAERRPAEDPLDEEAIRMRVRARVALVEDGDYFALLGLGRTATSYEIRRAYLELRRFFEPSRLLTAATADLQSDVRLVIEVLDEAYEILKDGTRRERYRRAIEAGPPA